MDIRGPAATFAVHIIHMEEKDNIRNRPAGSQRVGGTKNTAIIIKMKCESSCIIVCSGNNQMVVNRGVNEI